MAVAILTSLLTSTLWTIYGNEVEKVSDKVIARAARALRGDPSLPGSQDLQAALVRCWTQALKHFCRSYETKIETFVERLYLNDIVKLGDDLARDGIKADLGDFDQVRLRNALSDPSKLLDHTNTIDLVAFLEARLGAMPDGIRSALLDGIPPDCPEWNSCFSLFVKEEMKSSPEVFQIFVAERLASVEMLVEANAQTTGRIETSLGDLARTSTETGHDIRWIIDRLKQLPSVNETDLTEIAAFFGIYDADGAAAARKAIMAKAVELGVLKDRVVEQEAAERELTRIAFVDHLTGAPNRAHFHRDLGVHSQCTRKEAFVRHLAFLDIDAFHQINNLWGHDAGDHVLCEIAHRLQDLAIASETIFCRYGGDEFLFGFEAPEEETERLQDLAEAARREVSVPISYLAQNFRITASVGLSVYDAGVAIERSIKSADVALYRAKESGRDRAVLFEQRFDEEGEERRGLEIALREAIKNDDLQLHYGPVVNAAMEIVGFEAFVRWHNPERGWISPATFVPIAEDCGLIRPIGDWVLRTACAEAVHWPQPIRITVNISPIQWGERLIDQLQLVLAETGLAAERLELEVTEYIFVVDTAVCLAVAKKIDALGITLALDDFGTGYSSLGQLHRMPFKSIKIDQSFIRSVADGDIGTLATIRGLVAMAGALGLEVTAEGIETEADFLLVKELGCARMQGFYWGKPMDAEAVRQAIS